MAPNEVPLWLQYGSFGLLTLVLAGIAYFVRWLAKSYFEKLVASVQAIEGELKALRAALGDFAREQGKEHAATREAVRDSHARTKYRLGAIADSVEDTRTEAHEWHVRLENTVREGRRVVSTSTGRMEAVKLPPPRPRERMRSRPEFGGSDAPDSGEDSDRRK